MLCSCIYFGFCNFLAAKMNILYHYPYEILDIIIDNLPPTQIAKLQGDPYLAQSVYRKIFSVIGFYNGPVDALISDQSTNISPETYFQKKSAIDNQVTERCTLKFDDIELLRRFRRHGFLQKFGRIQQSSNRVIHDSELKWFREWVSFKVLNFVNCEGRNPDNLPPKLESLGLLNADITEKLSDAIKELSLNRLIASGEYLPKNLSKLSLSYLRNPLSLKGLPTSLKTLEIIGKDTAIDTNLQYLINLKMLLLDNVHCDSVELPDVEILEIRKTILLDWNVPSANLRSLKINDCDIPNPGFFSQHFPQSLEKLHFVDINIVMPNLVTLVHGIPKEIRLIRFEISNVVDFKFSSRSEGVHVFGDTVFSPTLYRLEMYNVEGFYDQGFTASLAALKLPLGLTILGLCVPHLDIPEGYQFGKELRSLYLPSCGLRSLDLKYTNLEELYVPNNFFQRTSDLKLPDSLLDLDLLANCIKEIDILPANLLRLDISSNQLNKVGDNVVDIRDLNISYNALRNIDEIRKMCNGVVHQCGDNSSQVVPCVCHLLRHKKGNKKGISSKTDATAADPCEEAATRPDRVSRLTQTKEVYSRIVRRAVILLKKLRDSLWKVLI